MSTLTLLIANAVPVWGVVFWGWDSFVLLMLYWLETAVIGFWMVARIAAYAISDVGKFVAGSLTTWKTAFVVIGFFVIFTGLFVVAYFHFLWQLFAGGWSEQIHGASDFIGKLVIGTGMWMPLLVLFLARGCGFLFQLLAPELLEKFERAFNFPVLGRLDSPRVRNAVTIEFFSRIIVVSMTIFLTFYLLAFISIASGTYTPQIWLIVAKTIADLIVHVKFESGGAASASETAAPST